MIRGPIHRLQAVSERVTANPSTVTINPSMGMVVTREGRRSFNSKTRLFLMK